MLFTELRKGRSVDIGGAKVTVVGIDNRHNRVRLSIDADKSIDIKHERKESRSKR